MRRLRRLRGAQPNEVRCMRCRQPVDMGAYMKAVREETTYHCPTCGRLMFGKE